MVKRVKATAAVLRTPDGRFELEEVDLDEPRTGEVLVELAATGFCHTDTSMRERFRGTPLPAVFGHEGAGRVVASGSGSDLAAGQPVVLSFRYCGECRNCCSGSTSYCDSMMALNFGLARTDGTTSISRDGESIGSHYFGQSSFATHAVVDSASVVPVGDDIDLGIVGPLGCGVQTGAGAVFNNLRPRVGGSFAVVGAGSVGLSGLLAAVHIGCDPIIAVDRNPTRLDLAMELGASHAFDASADGFDLTEAFMEATRGRGVERCFDTTGIGVVISSALAGTAVRGTVGTVAASGEASIAEVSLRQLLPGRSLTGILEGDSMPQVFIPELLALHGAGKFPFDRLITHFDFAEINEAEAASNEGRVVKPVLRMPGFA